jgi:hypothetical protein
VSGDSGLLSSTSLAASSLADTRPLPLLLARCSSSLTPSPGPSSRCSMLRRSLPVPEGCRCSSSSCCWCCWCWCCAAGFNSSSCCSSCWLLPAGDAVRTLMVRSGAASLAAMVTMVAALLLLVAASSTTLPNDCWLCEWLRLLLLLLPALLATSCSCSCRLPSQLALLTPWCESLGLMLL